MIGQIVAQRTGRPVSFVVALDATTGGDRRLRLHAKRRRLGVLVRHPDEFDLFPGVAMKPVVDAEHRQTRQVEADR